MKLIHKDLTRVLDYIAKNDGVHYCKILSDLETYPKQLVLMLNFLESYKFIYRVKSENCNRVPIHLTSEGVRVSNLLNKINRVLILR